MAAPNKIDSNVVGLSWAEEESLGVLPPTPVWYELEPNSYSDFGGDYKTVSRSPINASRQRQRGTLVDLDAAGGFNTDLTQSNMLRMLQGFFFATAHEKPCNLPLNGTAKPITAIVGGVTDQYQAASGLDVFLVNHLVWASGNNESGNNGLKLVDEVAAGYVGVSTDLTAEAAPAATSKLQAVGYQFPATDLSATASAGNLRLTSAAITLTTLGLNVGEWIFIGGDTAGTKFATCPSGYARVKTIAATYIDCDRCTFTPQSDVGTDKTVRIWFGTVLRNEKTPSLITRRTCQLERLLGSDDTTDASKIQSEYLVGAVPNDFKLAIPTAGKVTADLSFVGQEVAYQTGTVGKKTGTRVSVTVEDAFNTSSDLYRARMAVLSTSDVNAAGLYAYISEMNLEVKNGVTGNKALGVLGNFDMSAGNFEVDGSATAYFSTTAANSSIAGNSDIEMNVILAQRNAGQVWDMPLMSLSGGKLTVDKDKPVTVPLKSEVAECAAGYTLMHVNFPYLPDLAMPTV